MTTESPAHWGYRVALAVALIAAAALRLAELPKQSIWFDEAATIYIVERPTFGEMMTRIRADERTPPLHYIVLRYWIKLFGGSEISVRLPSAIASIAAVWVLYLLVRRLFGIDAALAAAMLLAVSRFHILYAAEARAYSFMLLLGMLSCDLFVRLIEKATRKLEIAYVLVTAALLYSHLYGVFVIAAQWIGYLFIRSPQLPWRRWIILNAAVLALFSPWIPTTIAWSRSVAMGIWQEPTTLADIPAAYRTLTGSTAMLVLLLLFTALAIYTTPRQRRGSIALLLSLTLLPVVVPVLAALLNKSAFTPRYAIIAPAALCALAAAGIVRARGVWFAWLLILIALALTGRAADWKKPDWRGAGRFLRENIKPTDAVVLNRKNSTYLYDYYVKRPEVPRRGFDSTSIPVDEKQYPRVWLVMHGDLVDPATIIQRGGWRVVSKHDFDHVQVFELSPPPTTAPYGT